MNTHRHVRDRHGFTLVELLVVVAIISLLVALLVPALSRAKATSVSTQCLTNLRGLDQMLIMYTNEYESQTPCIYWFWNSGAQSPGVMGSLQAYDEAVPIDSTGGTPNWATVQKIYKNRLCPANKLPCTGWNYTTYSFNDGVFASQAPLNFPLKKLNSITRPSEIIAMGDAPQFFPPGNYTWWDFNQPPFTQANLGGGVTGGGSAGVSGNTDGSGPTGLRYRHFEGLGNQSDCVGNVNFVDGHAESIKYGKLLMFQVDAAF